MNVKTATLQVDEDGSLTIPSELIRALRLTPHQQIRVEAHENQLVIALPPQEKIKRIGQLLKIALADVEWDEVEAGREDRWF